MLSHDGNQPHGRSMVSNNNNNYKKQNRKKNFKNECAQFGYTWMMK